MINNINFNKVKKIPSSLEPNSFYFVESGNYTEAFLTTQTGDLKKIGDEGTVTVYEQFEALEDQTEFTLSHLVKETNDYAVFINGLLQPEDFYQIEDNTLIFSEPLGEGDIVALHGLIRNLWSIPGTDPPGDDPGTDPPGDDPSRIYGVRWSKTASPDLERVYDSVEMVAEVGVGDQIVQNDFDDTWFNFEKVQDDYGNHFVRVPKFYIRKHDGGSYFEWAVSQVKHDDSYYLPWCFWDFDNEKELPYVDVGAYEASLKDDKLASVAGVMPLVSKNIINFREYAEANNTGGLRGYQQYDVHVHDIIQTLLFIEFATLNLQSIMMGNVEGSKKEPTGFSDQVAASSGSPVDNTSGKYPCVWRGIENPYGNIFKWVDGINIINYRAWVCKDSARYASNVFANPYEQLNYTNATLDGYVTSMGFDSTLPFAQFPINSGGSDSTYFCDHYYQSSDERVARVGGNLVSGSNAGPSFWYLQSSSSSANMLSGGRLLKKAL